MLLMEKQKLNVLFLCTHNSARSVMAEGLMTIKGKGRFVGYSAGSQPSGRVNPFAIEILKTIGYPAQQVSSKSWDVFASANAPKMDMVITVCDNAAGEVCPVWPGHPLTAHWGFADPSATQGSDEDKRAAFKKIFHQIETHIDRLVAMPLNEMSATEKQIAVRQIAADLER